MTDSILQVVVDPTKAESGTARVSAAVSGMVDKSLRFLQTLQSRADASFSFIERSAQTFSSRATSSFDTFAKRAAASVDSLKKHFTDLGKHSGDVFNGMQRSGTGLAAMLTTIFSVVAIERFIDKMLEVNNIYTAFMATMTVSISDTSKVNTEFDYLFNLAQGLGVSFEGLTKSYAKFSAAVKGTILEGKGAKEIFESISQVSTVLHSKGYDTERMFYAITQSISKGRIYREELTQQLAEKLPAAMQTAAKAMYPEILNIEDAQKKLNKALSDGTINVYEFWLKFSQALKNEYGPAAEKASQMANAQFERLKNQIFKFFIDIGQNGAMAGLVNIIKAITRLFTASTESSKYFGSAIGEVFNRIANVINQVSARDLNSFFKGISLIFTAVAESFNVFAIGLESTKTQGTGFLGFAEIAAKTMIIFASAITQVVNALRLMGTYLSAPKKPETISGFMGTQNGEQFRQNVANAKKYIADEKKNLAEREIAWSRFGKSSDETERALSRIDEAFKSVAKNQLKISDAPLGNTPSVKFNMPVAMGEDELNKILAGTNPAGTDPTKEQIASAKKLQNEYNSLIAAMKERATLAEEELDSGDKLTKSQKQYNKDMYEFSLIQSRLSASQKEKFIDMAKEALSVGEATEAYKRMSDAVNQVIKDREFEAESLAKILSGQDDMIESVNEQSLALDQQIAVFGKTEGALRENELARLAETAAAYDQAVAYQTVNGESKNNLDFLQAMADKYRALKLAREDLYAKQDALKDLKEVAAKEKELAATIERNTTSISRSITDSLMRGFENGETLAENFKKTLKNSFKTLVLQPSIEFIIRPFIGAVTTILNSLIPKLLGGLGGGTGGGLISTISEAFSGGGGGLSGALSVGKTLFEGVSQGFGNLNNSFVEGIAGVGTFLRDAGFESFGTLIENNSAMIGKFAPFAAAAISLLQGDFKGAVFQGIGAAIGSIWGPVGGSIGAFVGKLVGGLFGKKKIPMVGSTASGVYENGVYTGSTAKYGKKDIGLQKTMGELNEAFAGTLGKFLSAFGQSDKVSAYSIFRSRTNVRSHFSAAFEGGSVSAGTTYGKAKRVNLSTAFQQFADNVLGPVLVQAIQKSKLPEGLKKFFDGMTKKEDVLDAINTLVTLNVALNDLPDVFKAVRNAMDTTNYAVSIAQLKARFEAINTYTGLFYTEQEQFGTFTKQLTRQFDELGQVLPTTRDGYRQLVDGLVVTDESTSDLFDGLIAMAPAMDAYFDQLEKQKDELNAVAAAMRGMEDFASLYEYDFYSGLSENYGAAFANRFIDGNGSPVSNINNTTAVDSPITASNGSTAVNITDPNTLNAIQVLIQSVNALLASTNNVATNTKSAADTLLRVSPDGDSIQTVVVTE